MLFIGSVNAVEGYDMGLAHRGSRTAVSGGAVAGNWSGGGEGIPFVAARAAAEPFYAGVVALAAGI